MLAQSYHDCALREALSVCCCTRSPVNQTSLTKQIHHPTMDLPLRYLRPAILLYLPLTELGPCKQPFRSPGIPHRGCQTSERD